MSNYFDALNLKSELKSLLIISIKIVDAVGGMVNVLTMEWALTNKHNAAKATHQHTQKF